VNRKERKLWHQQFKTIKEPPKVA